MVRNYQVVCWATYCQRLTNRLYRLYVPKLSWNDGIFQVQTRYLDIYGSTWIRIQVQTGYTVYAVEISPTPGSISEDLLRGEYFFGKVQPLSKCNHVLGNNLLGISVDHFGSSETV